MKCVYCDKELKSSADDYECCICSECKKPKYPFQQGIIEQQNKIAELEQENKQLKEQLEMYKAHTHSYYQQLQNYRNKIYKIDVKKLMSKKLTPEQKEIYYKGFANCERQISSNIADIQIEIRKQVCDEIREKLGMNKYNTCENTAFGVHYDYLKEILDQIEQAKESIDGKINN